MGGTLDSHAIGMFLSRGGVSHPHFFSDQNPEPQHFTTVDVEIAILEYYCSVVQGVLKKKSGEVCYFAKSVCFCFLRF